MNWFTCRRENRKHSWRSQPVVIVWLVRRLEQTKQIEWPFEYQD